MKQYQLFLILIMTMCCAVIFPGCKQEKAVDTKSVMEITTTPAGARVFIAGEEKGKTPLTLKAAKPLRRLFKFEKEGFVPTWEAIDFKTGKHTVNIQLVPVTAEVMITSDPSEAQVELNGKNMGETPLVLRSLPSGRGSATVKKVGFSPREASWDIKDARPQLINISLNSNIGTIAVDSTPGDATVYLDDMNCGTTPLSKKVEQGRHKLRVTKAGYTDYQELIICRRGEKISRSVQLHELPGSINVESEPAGAQVFINDAAQNHTPCLISNLEPGKYTVRVEKKGYDPESQEIKVPRGKQVNVSFDLGKNTGNIDLIVNPPGVTIYVDGNRVGVTEPDENQWTSKVFSIKGLKAGIHTITLAHKRAQPEQRVEKITVKKGTTVRTKTINIWIANAELKHKDGRTVVGCLRDENPLVLIFEPEKGVRQELRRDEIESLRILKDKE